MSIVTCKSSPVERSELIKNCFPLAVKKRVSSWVSGIVNEMRKKSPATIQKWVDSIAVDEGENSTAGKVKDIIEEENLNCDSNELKFDEPEASTSESNENLKEKFNEICTKLSLKNKKLELKNLLAKTSQKLKRGSSQDPPMEQVNDESSNDIIKDELPTINEINPETNNLFVQRSRIGAIGRSSSENPNPVTTRHRKLNDIGRSFSVANDNELPTAISSSENLIYDADEDISITLPSLNTSPSIISNNTNHSLSNSQSVLRRSPLLQSRNLREHSKSEGHQSPQVPPKNPLLRDSSFQVCVECQSIKRKRIAQLTLKRIFFTFHYSLIQVTVQVSNRCSKLGNQTRKQY